jgi:NTE family protein
MQDYLDADLVLQGGGVKGIALTGAVLELLKTYRFRRVAGTSAGSIVGALVAAGYKPAELTAAMNELQYDRVPDRRIPLPLVSEGLSLLALEGLYPGRYIHSWIREKLAAKNVHTFADLRLPPDPGRDASLSGDRAYKLVVTATDTTRGRALRLPWDYRSLFGLDPDTMSVADAVRMSMSIPVYFEPQRLTDVRSKQTSVIVDGGILTNFPVSIFDRTDGAPSRWPTFGIGIIPDLPDGVSTLIPGLPANLPGVLGLALRVMATAVVGHDQTYLDRPEVARRLIRIDTSGTGVVDFGIGPDERRGLFDRGVAAARTFLSTWQWEPARVTADHRAG